MSLNKTILNEVIKKNEYLLRSDDSIDFKAGIFLGFGATIFIGYSGFIFQAEDIKYINILALLLLLLSMLIFAWALWPRKYNTGIPSIQKLLEYSKLKEESAQGQLISNYKKALKDNNKITQHKILCFRVALILFLLSVLLISFNFIIK